VEGKPRKRGGDPGNPPNKAQTAAPRGLKTCNTKNEDVAPGGRVKANNTGKLGVNRLSQQTTKGGEKQKRGRSRFGR